MQYLKVYHDGCVEFPNSDVIRGRQRLIETMLVLPPSSDSESGSDAESGSDDASEFNVALVEFLLCW